MESRKLYAPCSIIELIREHRIFNRTVSVFSILFFLSTFYIVPSAMAIEVAIDAEQAKNQFLPEGRTDSERLSNTLQAIKEQVNEKQSRIQTRLQQENNLWQDFLNLFGLSGLLTENLDRLNSMGEQAELLNQKALQEFVQIEVELKAKNLPAIILQRHYDAVAKYQAEYQSFLLKLNQAQAATSLQDQQGAMGELNDYLGTQKFKRKQQEFDPENLPNKALQPDKSNTPKTTRDEFIQSGLNDSPQVKLAALGDFKFDDLQDASNPAYLTESDEIVLTQAIRDKAAELGHDAVTIYHWVRNNIEWIPGWGAVQNAELTLSARRGNAMDIASLTISLLRASQIPARYVHGTIEVPAEPFNNWMGSFNSIDAAANFASSNGIPITVIISGGQVDKVRMEHVWVEAAADFYPSRGENNRNADIWLELDPSFKQYEFVGGIDTLAISGLDTDLLAQNFIDSGSVNETENWVTNFDPAILQQAQEQARQNLENHVANNLSDPTVGDVTGGHKTIVREFPTLPSALPNRIVVSGQRYGHLPASLQQTVTWGLGKDLFGEPLNPVTLPFARVNNEKITLSFQPATEADQQTLESLLPEGDITDVSQLPNSIPSYLISVLPELELNDELISRGSPLKLGQEIDLVTQVKLVGRPINNRSYNVIAGSYLTVNAYAQIVSSQMLQTVQARIDSTRAKFESGEITQLQTLTQQDMLGDQFHAGGLAYYAQLLTLSRIVGLQGGNHYGLKSGMGTIGYEPNVETFFGIPRAISQGGVAFDIPIIMASANNDGDRDATRLFTLHTGYLSSALEHATPALMFASQIQGDPQPDAISAIKALQIAMEAGQRIYQITRATMGTLLPNIRHGADAMNEIRAALNAGKLVVTHTDAVTVPGWRGAGYVILDQDSWAGAFKISGGKNGSYDKVADGLLFSTAAALGYVDGKIGGLAGRSFMFSDRLTFLSKLARTSQALGGLALLVSFYQIFTNDSLSVFQKVGQMSTVLLGFGITAYVTAAAVALSPVAILPILIGILVAVTFAVSTAIINAIYFSLLLNPILRPRRGIFS